MANCVHRTGPSWPPRSNRCLAALDDGQGRRSACFASTPPLKRRPTSMRNASQNCPDRLPSGLDCAVPRREAVAQGTMAAKISGAADPPSSFGFAAAGGRQRHHRARLRDRNCSEDSGPARESSRTSRAGGAIVAPPNMSPRQPPDGYTLLGRRQAGMAIKSTRLYGQAALRLPSAIFTAVSEASARFLPLIMVRQHAGLVDHNNRWPSSWPYGPRPTPTRRTIRAHRPRLSACDRAVQADNGRRRCR